MQRESSLLLGTLLLGTLLLRRKVYKSKVWVPERIHPREQWMPILAIYLTLMVHFHMSMSIRDVMTEKFSPKLFLYSLFHYPKLFLYFSEGPKTFSLFTISLHKTFSLFSDTLGGIASICFKFHFQTDHQQTLRTHTQGCQGCQKIRNFVRNLKILIARSTIHPSLIKIKNHYWKT